MFTSLLSGWFRNSRPTISRKRRFQPRDGSCLESLEERIVLSYLGSFRVPANDGSGRASWAPTSYKYSYGGDVSAVDAEGDELWLSAHVHNLLVGKVSIPDLAKPSHAWAFKELPVAKATAGAIDITGGLRDPAVQDSQRSMVLGDLDPDGNRVRWVMHHYYNVAQTPYRVLGSYNTETTKADGPYGLHEENGEHVRDQLSGRYLADVPGSWASRVGGTHVSGGGGLPGQSFEGAGPSLYAYTPPPAGSDPKTPVTATPLLLYPFDDQLPEDQRRSLDGWNRASEPMDVAWIGDTVVFAARVAVGEIWYGSPDGPGDLYDRYNPYKGYHAAKYEMRLMFYHASDFAAVASGKINPWDPKPFANVLMPNLMGPNTDSQFNPVSMSWDPVNERLYIVQTRVDHTISRYTNNPVVHVHDLSEDDALKRWAFELTGQRPILMTFYSSDGSNSTTSTTSDNPPGVKADDGGLREFRSLNRLSDEEKTTSLTNDDRERPRKSISSNADRELSSFWSLENDEFFTLLNRGTKA